ncbi:hypothetical protein PR202_gb29361 [Eleusine coracana subsp. coracana]|uniref:Retrotransposon gag domain-containing protein n=1 Tax=Eleusine coracana subsp. coracana TaxID=191504 RepID=A0AAV5G021_ELECO|nr:hypothetical protein PR202_gb29361 [Eleusine coracana subsp. coracana]
MDAIIEECDQALQDAIDLEHDMIEAQDDLDAFKAAHLPIEGNWDEIIMEYGEQEDVEMAPVGINDVEMMDLEEPEEPEESEDIGQDMVRTRNQDDPESSQQGANAELSLAEVLATALNRQQNDFEILCRLVDITSHLARQGDHHNNNNQPRQSTCSDFLGTHLPTFERAREPLDVNHWLRQTETKFSLLECMEHQKTAFRAHFIPAGLMQRKFQEFMDLKQGGRNVHRYSGAFNHLAQYATEYVNTKDKKRYAFLHGMNATLKECLTWQTTGTYNDLVNAAIVQEGAMHQVEEEDHKRKAPASASAAPQAKNRLIYTSPTGQRFLASPQQLYQQRYGQNYSRPPQKQNFPPRAPHQQQNNQYRARYQQQGNQNARVPQAAD